MNKLTSEFNSLFSELSDSEIFQSKQFNTIKPYISSMLMIFLTVYGAHAVPNIKDSNSFLVELFKNPLFRVIAIAIISLVLKLDNTNGLLVAISFMISLQLIDRYEHTFLDIVDDTLLNIPKEISVQEQETPTHSAVVTPQVTEDSFNVPGLDNNASGSPL